MTGNKFVELEPRYLLDENWEISGRIPSTKKEMWDFRRSCWPGPAKGTEAEMTEMEEEAKMVEMVEEEKGILELIRGTRIEIAEAAETKKIFSEGEYDYLEAEIGMNIILPKGNIAEMRFHVSLLPKDKVVAIDGFPKDVIDEKEIIGGKIKVGISKAFKFIPKVGNYIGELLEIDLNPWEFKLGSLKRVKVDFSGGLTSQPEWYFKKDGIKNELRVALVIKKPSNIGSIEGAVRAAWLYDPAFLSFLRKRKFGTDEKNIKIFSE